MSERVENTLTVTKKTPKYSLVAEPRRFFEDLSSPAL